MRKKNPVSLVEHGGPASYLEGRGTKDLCQKAVILRGSMAFLSLFRRSVITDQFDGTHTEQGGLTVMPLTCIREFSGSNLGRDSDHPDRGLVWCSSDLPGKCAA